MKLQMGDEFRAKIKSEIQREFCSCTATEAEPDCAWHNGGEEIADQVLERLDRSGEWINLRMPDGSEFRPKLVDEDGAV